MLVLSRKQNEKIIVGDNVTITILKIRGNTVRIGIEAPRDIQVMRGELLHDQASCESPDTVEFRSNGTGTNSNSPSLRIVAREHGTSPGDRVRIDTRPSRMQQFVVHVGQVSDANRKAQ